MTNNQNPLVAVVIVNYNGWDVLPNAIQSLKNSDYRTLSIIVIDNNSTDGSIDLVAKQFKDLIVIQNSRNLGFAKGCNQGITKSTELNAKYILFLNSDATVSKNTISKLVEFLEVRKEICAAAPFICYENRPDIIWYGGANAALWRGWIGHRFIRRKYLALKYKEIKTDYLTGCIFLGRTDILKDIGGFSEEFLLYAEDVDLSLRLRKNGCELWVIPEAIGYHRVSQSAGGELSPFKAYHRGRSSALLYIKHLKIWYVPGIIIGGFIGGLAISFKLLLQKRSSTVISFWYGFFTGLFGINVPAKYKLKD